MANSNGKISAPVSIEDVRQVLTAGDRDLATLCKHPNINIWARRKPTDNDSLTDRGSSSGIKVTFDASANPYYAVLRKFTHDAPKGGQHSPYRLADFDGYNHNATSPLTSIVVNDRVGKIVITSRQTVVDDELTMADITGLYDKFAVSSGGADDGKPVEDGWYFCAVYLATSNVDDLLLAWNEKTKDDSDILLDDATNTTRSTKAHTLAVTSDGEDDGATTDDEPTTTDDGDIVVPYEPDNEVTQSQMSGWEFDTNMGTYNLAKLHFDTGNPSLSYFFWSTYDTPLMLCEDTITIDVSKVREPWNANFYGVENCIYHLGFVCLVNRKFDKNKEYEQGELQFLPIPVKKPKDAFFYISDNIDETKIFGGKNTDIDIDGEIADV